MERFYINLHYKIQPGRFLLRKITIDGKVYTFEDRVMGIHLCKIGIPSILSKLQSVNGDMTKLSIEEMGQYLEFMLRTMVVMSIEPKLKINEIDSPLMMAIISSPEFSKITATIGSSELLE